MGEYLIYLDKRNQKLVRVTSKERLIFVADDGIHGCWLYPVEDILTGLTYHLARSELSRPFNEMEIIAWAAI